MEKIKLIAHRGLINGPDKTLENKPEQIEYVLSLGFDCEIDLWIINDQFYLGHDNPQYQISELFLENVGLWIHAKNLAALNWLLKTNLCYFWHQEDSFTLTSNGYIWTYPEKELTSNSIRLMPEWQDPTLTTILNFQCAGICSDYINKIKLIIDNQK